VDGKEERIRAQQKRYKQYVAFAFFFWIACFIPVFIPLRIISSASYESYLQTSLIAKVLVYWAITQFLSFFLPFEEDGLYTFAGWKMYAVKLLVFAATIAFAVYLA
jgi:hypothetical protein